MVALEVGLARVIFMGWWVRCVMLAVLI